MVPDLQPTLEEYASSETSRRLPASRDWHGMPTQKLIDQAREFIQEHSDSPAACYIRALASRLSSSEYWIDSLEARLAGESQ